MTLNVKEKVLLPGMKFKLTATVSPSNATDKTIVWSSSDSGKATVDGSGNVVAVAVGTVTITAASTDGKHSAKCTVKVSDDASLFVQAKFRGGSYSMNNGLILYGSKLSYAVYNNSDKTITVKSVQLIDGQTGSEGNVLTIGSNIAPGANAGWSITIGLLGIHAPIAKFVFTYNGKEYVTSAQFSSSSLLSTTSESVNFVELN